MIVIGLLTVFIVGAAMLGQTMIARHRAMAGADLAALAAADALARADPDPCSHAARIAQRHSMELTECSAVDLVIDVEVAVQVGGLLPDAWVARVHSRAGPAEASGPT